MVRASLFAAALVSMLATPLGAQTADFKPVTREMLANPSPDDWLMLNRTYDEQRFSPLREINRDTVAGLELAWAQDQVEAGAQLYEEHCMGCHGEKLKAPGTSFDLRKLTVEQRSRFDKFVLDGKGQMPPWRGTLGQAELDQLWAYIRAHAD